MNIKGFFQTDNDIYDNTPEGMNHFEQCVYIYLCRCGNQGADAFPGYNTIARKCMIGRMTAIRAIRGLESKGFITIAKSQGCSNQYTLNPLTSTLEIPLPVPHRYSPSTPQVLPPVPHGHPKKNHKKEPGKKKQFKKKVTVVIEDKTNKEDALSLKDTVSTSEPAKVTGLSENETNKPDDILLKDAEKEKLKCAKCGVSSDDSELFYISGKPKCKRCIHERLKSLSLSKGES